MVILVTGANGQLGNEMRIVSLKIREVTSSNHSLKESLMRRYAL